MEYTLWFCVRSTETGRVTNGAASSPRKEESGELKEVSRRDETFHCKSRVGSTRTVSTVHPHHRSSVLAPRLLILDSWI